MLRLALRNNTDLLTKINTGIRLFSSTSINRGLERYFDQGKWGWRETDYSGRAWQASELRLKSFDDLHSIWWACCLEQNKLYSQWHDANRFRFDFPHRTRLEQTKLTMARIKQVLWERRIAWLQAQAVYKKHQGTTDERIDLVGKSPVKIRRILAKESRYSKPKRSTSWTVV